VSATQLYDAGYTELVSVIPPDGALVEGSKIDPSQRGKCPGRLGAGGWHGYAFTANLPTETDTRKWETWGANVGLLGDQFPGLDIDVDDETLSGVIVKYAAVKLGLGPVRLSRDPRRLLVFRTEEPFTRIALVVMYKGKSHLVEFLGKGRQYLVHGRHPAGVDYRWDGAPLWEWSPDDLPYVSAESALAFMEGLATALRGKGLDVELIGSGKAPEEAPPQEKLLAPSLDELERVVAQIPNPGNWGWERMIEMGYAIKAAGGEEARGIFLDWCGRWEVGNDPDLDARNWDSLKGPFRLGWNWLVERAEVDGAYVSAVDAFPAEVAPPEVLSVWELIDQYLASQEDPIVEIVEDPARIPFTDEWAVDRVLPRVRERLRFVPGAKSWHIWTGHQWLKDEGMGFELEVRDILQDFANELERRANVAPSAKEAKEPKAAARRLQSATGIRSVVDLLRAHLACPQDAFDRDRMALNTPAGVVNLRTGEITPAIPAGMHARSTAVGPAEGEPKYWLQFMEDLTGGDEDLIHYIQKMIGYALTGDVNEKTLWFIWGSDSDTGKSTFIRAVSELMGDYADSVDVSAFVSGFKGDKIPADLARLPGVRLVTATEPAAGHAWDEKRVKAITGGDRVNARFLYGQWFSFMPQFKIAIVGNHEPEIRNVDDAMLRRIHIVPFNRKVPRDKQIENLSAKLIEREGPQIMAWLIEGCLVWQREGLTPPEIVFTKTKEYESTEDLFGQWLEDECVLGSDEMASRQELYSAWSVWCRERGEEPGSDKTFKRKVESRKLEVQEAQVGTRRLRGYRGISLRADLTLEDV